jgi:N-acetylneuraminic acid mutarotase
MKTKIHSKAGFLGSCVLTVLLFCLAASFITIAIPTTSGLGFFRAETAATVSDRTLTFEERVAYQRAIEDVYWRHRIWPEQRPDSKPSLDAVMSHAQLEKKVTDYLRNSQAPEDYWQQPITAEHLQAEMDRMAQHTKQPDVLRELFEALGNDPFVIAECLARPVLTERLVAGLSAQDETGRLEPLRTADPQMPKKVAAIETRSLPSSLAAAHRGFTFYLADPSARLDSIAKAVQVNRPYQLPVIAGPSGGCTDDTWTSTSTANAPTGRSLQTAVWTGSEMIVWGGGGPAILDTGGRYNPSTDSWAATSTTNAPSARDLHTAVWTGTEMIVWGGYDGISRVNTGGKYNPGTDSWTATSTTNAPTGRERHTAVWSGTEMIIWGGFSFTFGDLNTGGKYNPATNSWTATSTTNAPTGREDHTAVWTDSEMIVWGGLNSFGNLFNTGGKYNPETNVWTATSTAGAPTARAAHTAVWAASEMIIWGGGTFSVDFNTGGRYDPNTNSWTATSTTNAPSARESHTAVWTNSEMIVWGGVDFTIPNYFDSGGRYDPVMNAWTTTSTTDAPSARVRHTAVWTDSEMIVWGGTDMNFNYLNTGGRYCAQSGAPTPTPTPTATATPTATPTTTPTPSATPTATLTPSPTPGGRPTPTPRPRPTPAPRP